MTFLVLLHLEMCCCMHYYYGYWQQACMGNACGPCEEIFCTKKSGHVFQIHLTSSNLWYYGAWKLQLFHYGLYKLLLLFIAIKMLQSQICFQFPTILCIKEDSFSWYTMFWMGKPYNSLFAWVKQQTFTYMWFTVCNPKGEVQSGKRISPIQRSSNLDFY